jgi:hypothetical protein
MFTDEQDAIRLKLIDMRLQHRDLDAAIQRMAESTYIDQIQLTRLKKQKLKLKDTIARLESKLIPDLNA